MYRFSNISVSSPPLRSASTNDESKKMDATPPTCAALSDEYTVIRPDLIGPGPVLQRPNSEQLRSLAAVPAAMVATSSRGGGKMNGKNPKRKGSGREKNVAIGNDSPIPFVKTLRDFTEIRIVGNTEPQTILTSSTTVPAFGQAYFTVSTLDNFASLATVFDEYHIDLIEVHAFPQVTEVTSAATGVGNWISVVDIDDGGLPTTVAQLTGYSSAVETTGTMAHFHSWKPRYAVATYSGAFTSYSSADGWCDCASPNIQWYGLKAGSPVAPVAQSYNFYARMHVRLRGLH